MKILIADDEELVRENLRDILQTMDRACEILEAVNGRTMIEKVRKTSPDICFVDIRMPGISGLEAIEKLIDDFPDISWIILSGYSEFEYARRALGLGVIDYLLKPAVEHEVESALKKAVSKRIENRRLKREKFEYRVSGVLNNSSAVEFDDYLQEISLYAALVCIQQHPCEEELSQQKELFRKLRGRLDRELSSDVAGVFNILDGFPAVIAGGDNPDRLLKDIEAEIPELYRLIYSPLSGSLPGLIEYFESAEELKETADSQVNEENPDRSSRIVRQAEKLVLKQYNKPIGVAQIADQLNVSPNYLSSLFKKYKSESFTKFITDIRLKEATVLLEIPGMTVKDASQRLGYMSSRHFARLFREKYGMTPTDYISRNS